jgi:hypothetical protein
MDSLVIGFDYGRMPERAQHFTLSLISTPDRRQSQPGPVKMRQPQLRSHTGCWRGSGPAH